MLEPAPTWAPFYLHDHCPFSDHDQTASTWFTCIYLQKQTTKENMQENADLLTNDESHLTVWVIKTTGHHGCYSVIYHGQQLHVHPL